jgi:hypothetical protein
MLLHISKGENSMFGMGTVMGLFREGGVARNQRPGLVKTKRGQSSMLNRIYRWSQKGREVTMANGMKYVVSNRGPWVRKDRYVACHAPQVADMDLGSAAWIRED